MYAAVFVVLLRFYWGRGMFNFHYYEYRSMYYPTVLLLIVTLVPHHGRISVNPIPDADRTEGDTESCRIAKHTPQRIPLVYRSLKKRMPAVLVFAGEMAALGLCWCPSVILYNYLTYLLMSAGMLLLYEGILQGNAAYAASCDAQPQQGTGAGGYRYYVLAGVCLGANVAVRMPNVVQEASSFSGFCIPAPPSPTGAAKYKSTCRSAYRRKADTSTGFPAHFWFVPHMFLCVMIVYAAGTAVDLVRQRLFDLVTALVAKPSMVVKY